MAKIYIAGPMRNNSFASYEHFNYDAFDKAAKALRAEGWVVISPTEIDRLHEGWGKYPPEDFAPTREFFIHCMRRDLAILLEFHPGDAIFVLPGWFASKGAKAETALARALGLNILTSIQSPT